MYWLAFLLGLGGLYLYNHHEVHEAEISFPPIGQFVTVDSVKLHYLIQGDGQPVVFFHGSSGQIQDFSMSIFDLMPTRYQSVAFDRPGHGYSERPPGQVTLEQQARLFHDALDKLGVQKPILVGYSWSGALVLSYALQFPHDVKGLVLQSGYMYPEEGSGVQNYVPKIPVLGSVLLHTLLIPVGRLKQHADPARSDNGLPPANYVALSRALALRPGAIAAAAEDDRLEDESCEKMDSLYPGITLPVAIVTGDSDRVVPPANQGYRLHTEIPQSQLLIVHGGGHDLQWTTPDAIIQAIDMVEDGQAAARTDTNSAR